LVKIDGSSTVYYLGADGKRYIFPNEATFFSWYKDFSGVVTVSQTELENSPRGAVITIRPGTKLIKTPDERTVYAVEPGGILKSIVSESNATALWGANWAKRVVDVIPAFMVAYQTGTPLSAGVLPVGSLVKTSASADIYYFDGAAYRKFDNEAAMSANKFDMANVVTVASVSGVGTPISGVESALTDIAGGARGTIGAGSGLTVAVSANSAPSGTLIVGQAIANLGSFNLTAANDGDVKVTTIKLKRTGISADSVLSNVYLYDGNTRITDNASVSSGYINFTNASGIVNVTKGTTKTITVKSNITGGSGNTVGVSINAASDVITDGAAVSGSFPASTNVMSIASATLATVNFATSTPTPLDNGSVDIQNDFTMWQNTVTIGERAVNLGYITFREIGSISASDLKNFRLFIDGVQVGSAVAALDANGYVAFDFGSTPKRIESGARTMKVVGDITGGSTRTFSLSLRQASDVVVVDTEYGANVLATVNSATFTSCTSGVQTLTSGSLTVTRATDSPTANVIVGSTGVTLAKFTLVATGEPIKIETLTANVTLVGATTNLKNGAIFANGAQIGSTANLTTAGNAYTVNYTVNPGSNVALEIRADIATSSTPAIPSGSTITANLVAGVNNAQGVNSMVLKSTGAAAGLALNVTTGGMTLSKTGSYSNQNVVVPQSGAAYKLASFVLSGNASEDVNLNNITVDFNASGTFAAADLTNVYIKYGSVTGSVKPTVSASNNSWSVTQTLAKNTSMTVEVYGNIGSDITANDSATTTVVVTGTTAVSVQTTSATAVGQLITAAAGRMVSALDASSASAKITAGSKSLDAAVFKFTTINDAYTITEIVATTTANGGTVVVNVLLKDGDTVLATQTFNGTTTTFSGLSIAIPANSSKTLKVALDLGTVGSGAGTTGANAAVSLASYKANTSGGGPKTQANESDNGGTAFATREGAAIYVYKSIPTITNVALPSATLVTGTNVIGKITIASDVNAIAWNKIAFTYATSTGITLSSIVLKDDSNNTVATGVASGTTLVLTPSTEKEISGSKTYTLQATVGGIGSGYNYVSTSIARPSSFATSVAASNTALMNVASFVWSDESGVGHSTITTDWTNDNLVKNLATDSQVITVSVN
jgi:hypothetical protein